MNGYNFEGLWFEIYTKVINYNEQLGKQKLDRNQLREVATSIFIANTHKGICRPEDEEEAANIEVPSHLKDLGDSNGNNRNSNSSNNRNGRNGNEHNSNYQNNGLATEKQLKTIQGLLNNHLVTDKEKSRIENILAQPEVSKNTASDILTYYLGNSEKIDGEWIKISQGILDTRKSKQPA